MPSLGTERQQATALRVDWKVPLAVWEESLDLQKSQIKKKNLLWIILENFFHTDPNIFVIQWLNNKCLSLII